jgi:hypothetical protein
MSYKSNWSNGGWLTICDACGRKFKESELRKRWDGLMVCRNDWEVRQPQDYVRGVADIQAPPYVRPEQKDRFLPYNFTQYPNETVDVEERIAKQFTKLVGGRVITDSAINGSVINLLAINALSNVNYDPEKFILSETVMISLGRSLSDTLNFAESVSTNLFSLTALNGSSINSLGLD